MKKQDIIVGVNLKVKPDRERAFSDLWSDPHTARVVGWENDTTVILVGDIGRCRTQCSVAWVCEWFDVDEKGKFDYTARGFDNPKNNGPKFSYVPGFTLGGSFKVIPPGQLEIACEGSLSKLIDTVGIKGAAKFLCQTLSPDLRSALWTEDVKRRLAERETEPRPEGRDGAKRRVTCEGDFLEDWE